MPQLPQLPTDEASAGGPLPSRGIGATEEVHVKVCTNPSCQPYDYDYVYEKHSGRLLISHGMAGRERREATRAGAPGWPAAVTA